jgi:hypothetical protein
MSVLKDITNTYKINNIDDIDDINNIIEIDDIDEIDNIINDNELNNKDNIENIDINKIIFNINSIEDIDDIETEDDETEDDETEDTENEDIDTEDIDIYDINYTNNYIIKNFDISKKMHLIYNEHDEIVEEQNMINYNKQKNSGQWIIAKSIISQYEKNDLYSEYVFDYIDLLFKNNNDSFENINKIYYKYSPDSFLNDNENNIDNIGNIDNIVNKEIVHEFTGSVAKYFIDNLKICKFKQHGYIFNNNANENKWKYSIIIITSKNIYSANRYINDKTIGFY